MVNTMTTKYIILRIGRIILAAIASLCLLDLFVLIYSFSGVHITNESHATDYVWEPNQTKRTLEEGFAFVQMDELGYNNVSVLENVDYLIMGSSNVEAVNVGTHDNFVALLNDEYKDVNFYNIGISGHQIYNCVNNLADAAAAFVPKKAIVLVTDSIELDIESMSKVVSGNWERIPSYDTGALFYIQKKAPVIKTLYKKVLDWKDAEAIKADSNNDVVNSHNAVNYLSDEYVVALQQFISFAKKNAGDVELIIVYQPSTRIDSKGLLDEANNQQALDLFEITCENNNIEFVDMTEDFRALYENEHILAHGFTNTAVGAGHLNRYGHQTIAERLSEFVEGELE